MSIQLPKPVDDTTQNANLKAEYAGSTPWGKPFNVALGYGVSVYNDQVGCGSVAGFRPPGSSDANCLTFQNPWIAANTLDTPLWNRYSLPPDNQAQNFTATGGVGLPFNSRYMGTFQYTMDDAGRNVHDVDDQSAGNAGDTLKKQPERRCAHDPVQQRAAYADHLRSGIEPALPLLRLSQQPEPDDHHGRCMPLPMTHTTLSNETAISRQLQQAERQRPTGVSAVEMARCRRRV